MAEIEHFHHPNDKTHPKYSQVINVKIFIRIFYNLLGNRKFFFNFYNSIILDFYLQICKTIVTFYSACNQLDGKSATQMTIEKAIENASISITVL